MSPAPDQSEENPLGVGGMELHRWLFPLRQFREMHGEEGGEVNASSAVVEERRVNIGATIMGRNMFGPVRGPWPDESWRGWSGEYRSLRWCWAPEPGCSVESSMAT